MQDPMDNNPNDNNDFGDFFLDNDGLNEDVELSILDTAKQNVLKQLEKTVKEALVDLDVNERDSASARVKLISNYTDLLIRLDSIDEDNTPQNEIEEIIDEVLKQTTEITLSNMDNVLKSVIEDGEDGSNGGQGGNPGSFDPNSGLDF